MTIGTAASIPDLTSHAVEPSSGAAHFRVVVTSKDHADRGVAGGFMSGVLWQGGRASAHPARRRRALLLTAPSLRPAGRCQAFTARPFVGVDDLWLTEMNEGFCRRRRLRFTGQREVPIAPLLPELSFTAAPRNWDIAFRNGLFQIAEADFRRVERQMIGGSISAPA